MTEAEARELANELNCEPGRWAEAEPAGVQRELPDWRVKAHHDAR
ncbi:MAG TPA: hypothetical protein VGP82_14575 [Ktedonobacterales bacterium]|nr:hypothetical protein [Ktedonobacterales bacterium]